MSNKGFSNIGLSTLDLDKTQDFYENVLRFKSVRCDIIKIKEGVRVRHMFFDLGHGQLIAFMESRDVDTIPADYDAGIDAGLGVSGPFYHFAFESGSVDSLEAKRLELIGKSLTVTDVVDHEWAKSIYFKDPNGISLEFCCLTRDVGNEDDVTMQERAEISIDRWMGDNYIEKRISAKEPALNAR